MGKKELSTSSGTAIPSGKQANLGQPPEAEITQVLQQWRNGDASAFDRLAERVYDQLRHLADQALGKGWGNKSLQPTELVHEAYLRLLDARQLDWKSRSHFFGVAARLMRQILVDRARARVAQKRGGGALRVSIESAEVRRGTRNRDVNISSRACESCTDWMIGSSVRQSSSSDISDAEEALKRYKQETKDTDRPPDP